MSQPSLDQYGIVGNTYTTALIGLDGSVDWLCTPKHDSPSLFARLLDDEKGGHFCIRPMPEAASEQNKTPSLSFETQQLYWPGTNVLITRFLSLHESGEITDFMPVGLKDPNHRAERSLIRQVKAVQGDLTFELICQPAFNYARDEHEVELSESGAHFRSKTGSVELSTQVPLQQKGEGVQTSFYLKEGEVAVFLLRSRNQQDQQCEPLTHREAQELLDQTVAYWHRWLSQCTYRGRWREEIERSALLLKLLTYAPTGAIIAAPTTSLPESLGAGLNWDYRYTWVRDSAYALYALMHIGFKQEATQFIRWIEDRCQHCVEDGFMKVAYTIDGEDLTEEIELNHLKGYRNSTPVRIGNVASEQFQLDIYGAFMDAVYLSAKYGEPVTYEFWQYVCNMLDWLCESWQRDDQSIWEPRNEMHQFVHSKVMVWVALDRGLRLAEQGSFPADRDRWIRTRDEIYAEVMEKGWDESQGSFIQHYDTDVIDAGQLIMPLVFFLSPNDPRLLSMLDQMLKPLSQGGLCANNLVYRHNTEQAGTGEDGEEGTFSLCTLWMVEALTRAGKFDRKRLNQAQLIFEEFRGWSNHLGLYAEEIRPNGKALGNFPQAFTHLAFISAASNLNEALDQPIPAE